MNQSRRKTALSIKPSDYFNARIYLQRLYDALLKAHRTSDGGGSYTFKKFAEELGFGSTTIMHQLVKGHRPITLKTIDRVILAIGIKHKERIYLRTLVSFEASKSVGDREKYFQKLVDLKQQLLPNELDKAALEYLSAWYHPVIREVVCLPGAKGDPEWVASKLRIKLDLRFIKDSLELLQRIGYIEFDEDKDRYWQTTQHISSGPRVRGLGIVGFHQEMIEQAKSALTKVESKRRNFGSLTFSCTEETAAKIRAAADKFQDQVIEMLKDDDGDQVHQMNIQVFPFTDK